jgi:RNA polymerase sigma factor (TIGR02999 family)
VSDLTAVLDRLHAGDPRAKADLFAVVYDELRRMAASQMAAERPDHTLDATSLVHEAYLRLVGDQPFNGRGHFFAAAAEAMRRILIDAARRKLTVKHGGAVRRVALPDTLPAPDTDPADLLALDEALTRLEGHDPTATQLVRLRYFAGLGHQEAAAALGLSRRTADGLWALARAWLIQDLSG